MRDFTWCEEHKPREIMQRNLCKMSTAKSSIIQLANEDTKYRSESGF